MGGAVFAKAENDAGLAAAAEAALWKADCPEAGPAGHVPVAGLAYGGRVAGNDGAPAGRCDCPKALEGAAVCGPCPKNGAPDAAPSGVVAAAAPKVGALACCPKDEAAACGAPPDAKVPLGGMGALPNERGASATAVVVVAAAVCCLEPHAPGLLPKNGVLAVEAAAPLNEGGAAAAAPLNEGGAAAVTAGLAAAVLFPKTGALTVEAVVPLKKGRGAAVAGDAVGNAAGAGLGADAKAPNTGARAPPRGAAAAIEAAAPKKGTALACAKAGWPVVLRLANAPAGGAALCCDFWDVSVNHRASPLPPSRSSPPQKKLLTGPA
jgi:hypothetical protein